MTLTKGAWGAEPHCASSLGEQGLIHCGDLRSRCPTRQPVPGRPSGQTAQCENQLGVAIAGEWLSRPMWYETGGGPKKDGKACFALFDTNKAQKKAFSDQSSLFLRGYVRRACSLSNAILSLSFGATDG